MKRKSPDHDKISTKCGRGICPFYTTDKNRDQSKCLIYDDRINCKISMKQRRHGIRHSREYADNFYG